MAVNKTELPSSKGNGGEEELDAIVVKTGDNFMLEYEVFANKRSAHSVVVDDLHVRGASVHQCSM